MLIKYILLSDQPLMKDIIEECGTSTVIHDRTYLASLGSCKLLLLASNEDGQLIVCTRGRERDCLLP